MVDVVEIDNRKLQVTPFFKIVELENVPKSEASGFLVKELKEVVEVRIAGNNNFSPVFPAHAFYERKNGKVITYAERWAEAYRRFKEGSPQEAEGTPIAVLAKYGITPEEESICRTFKIYSVEALYALEGDQLKNLGMSGNKLKEKAKAFMADRAAGANALEEIAKLRAQLAELQASSTGKRVKPEEVAVNQVPEKDPSPQEMAGALVDAMGEEELRAYIANATGAEPSKSLSIDKLRNMAKSL